MQEDILSKSVEELILLYHEINKELRNHLLSGDAWQEQQERIRMLTQISKELTRRKVRLEKEEERGAGG
jgi:hypothetical protein